MVKNLSILCGKEAEKHGCEKYIEVSTGQVYKPGKKLRNEKAELKPWTNLAKYKLEAEDELQKMKDLPLIILRPSIIYGPGDQNGLLPRIICGSTYVHTKGTMKLLWNSELKINCVHVVDVAKSIIHCFKNVKTGSIYNISDSSDLSQGSFNKILEDLFGIKTSFVGQILSTLAQTNLKDVVDTANENHMNPWYEMLKDGEISHTPLSPYLDIELLLNNSLSIDGSAIESTGFKYTVPKITLDLVKEEVKYWQDLKFFPIVKKLE